MAVSNYVLLFAQVVKEMVEKPIPDEITVMSMGAQVAHRELSFLGAFVAIYAGVAIVLLTGYAVGTVVRTGFIHWLTQRGMILFTQDEAVLDRNRYLGWALCLSFFFPVVRHLVPFLVGVTRMPFRQFLLFYLPGTIVWTLHYCLAGYWFADRMDELVAGVYTYSKITLIGLWLIGVMAVLALQLRRIVKWSVSGGRVEGDIPQDQKG